MQGKSDGYSQIRNASKDGYVQKETRRKKTKNKEKQNKYSLDRYAKKMKGGVTSVEG